MWIKSIEDVREDRPSILINDLNGLVKAKSVCTGKLGAK
jgi:hypothetical protein